MAPTSLASSDVSLLGWWTTRSQALARGWSLRPAKTGIWPVLLKLPHADGRGFTTSYVAGIEPGEG